MENFFENSFARMYGPHFLLFYGALIILVILFMRKGFPWMLNRNKSDIFFQPIPHQPDPYEIAYVQAGDKEIMMLSIFSLIKRGYLSVLTNDDKSDVWIGQRKITPPLYALNPYETVLFNLLDHKERPIRELFDKAKTMEKMQECSNLLRTKLEEDGLIFGDSEMKKFNIAKTIGVNIIFWTGVYKLIAANMHGHSNLFGLIVIGIFGCVIVTKLKIEKQRPSSRGNDYIDQLKKAFSPSPYNDFDAQLLYMQQLQLAIYGVSILENTRYAYIGAYYKYNYKKNDGVYWETPEVNGSGSGCGSGGSCSGSSCGGGCGGGCGGCS